MSTNHRTTTPDLISAMSILSREIQSDDGVANAVIAEAAERLGELWLLVSQCWPLVQAQHGAEHMLDGFRPRARPEIDALLERLLHQVGAPS